MNTSTCACLAHIDAHGDHLLGCGHGPLRICRHDSIVNLLYHTLSQEKSNIRLEEWNWGATTQRPGDIYHPDFLDGHPAYFDVLVRNMLQLGNLNHASTNAGAAAIAGEMEKDNKHAGSVEEVGGRFFSLVTEMLGVWTPSSLFLLRTFTEITTLHNGLSPSIAALNLMQQLSVKLWSYNAKMILQHFGPSDNGASFIYMYLCYKLN